MLSTESNNFSACGAVASNFFRVDYLKTNKSKNNITAKMKGRGGKVMYFVAREYQI